jgi:hypothetical protein
MELADDNARVVRVLALFGSELSHRFRTELRTNVSKSPNGTQFRKPKKRALDHGAPAFCAACDLWRRRGQPF